jgi:SPP1 family predicted phage head-tail adaptor
MSLCARLNKRVQLQRPATGQDSAGQPLDDWDDVVAEGDKKVWAEVRDVAGREFVAAGATRNSVTTIITVRRRAGIGPDMRVLHGEKIYNIEAVLEPDQRTLQLMCSRPA